MDYFKFFNIPQTLDLDVAALKQQFYANSKKFHPDFFTLEKEHMQAEALEQSTINNTAYKTLVDFDRRLYHLLTLNNILEEEGKNSIPQDFLMEMMEINELVMELQFDFDEEAYRKILKELKNTKADLRSNIDHIIPKKGDEIIEADFIALRDYYLKSKYVSRLEENIKKLG